LRDRTQRAELRLKHLRRLDAEFEALVVVRRNQLLVGGHLLEAVVPIGETGHALWLEQLEQFGAKRPVGDFAQGCEVRKDVGKIEHLELPDADRAELGVRRRQHLNRAELERLQFFLVLVERRIRIDLDLDLAAGIFLREFLELFGGGTFRRVGGDDVAELDDDRRLRRRGSYQSQCRDRRRSQDQFTHVSSRVIIAERASGAFPMFYSSGTNTEKPAEMPLPL